MSSLQLVHVGKVSYYPRSGSRNVSVSFLKRRWDLDSNAEVVLQKLDEDSLVLTRNKNKDAEGVCLNISLNKKYNTCVMTVKKPLRWFFKPYSLISFFYDEEKDEYVLKRASENEALMRRPTTPHGDRSGTHKSGADHGMCIQKKDKFFFDHKGGFKVTMHVRPRLYVEIVRVRGQGSLPRLTDIRAALMHDTSDTYVYYAPPISGQVFRMPSYFMRKADLKDNDRFYTEFIGSKYYIYPPVKDDVTGDESIGQEYEEILVSKKTKDVFCETRKIFNITGINDLSAVLCAIEGVNKQIASICGC